MKHGTPFTLIRRFIGGAAMALAMAAGAQAHDALVKFNSARL
ncbi:hypothetical protein [Bordetella hinzii]